MAGRLTPALFMDEENNVLFGVGVRVQDRAQGAFRLDSGVDAELKETNVSLTTDATVNERMDRAYFVNMRGLDQVDRAYVINNYRVIPPRTIEVQMEMRG